MRINTESDLREALTEAIENNDAESLAEYRALVNGWMMPEDERVTWLRLIDGIECLMDEACM
jgi:hypothetical protein